MILTNQAKLQYPANQSRNNETITIVSNIVTTTLNKKPEYIKPKYFPKNLNFISPYTPTRKNYINNWILYAIIKKYFFN